jgi:hypothetical protein
VFRNYDYEENSKNLPKTATSDAIGSRKDKNKVLIKKDENVHRRNVKSSSKEGDRHSTKAKSKESLKIMQLEKNCLRSYKI